MCNVNGINRVLGVFLKCIKLKLHLVKTFSHSIKLMALGPAGFGPRVRARVDQAGGLKDAPARTLHPYTEEHLVPETIISKSRAF